MKITRRIFRTDLGRGRRRIEINISQTIHLWKYSWLKMQDENLSALERFWFRMQYDILGARMEMVRVRAKDRD